MRHQWGKRHQWHTAQDYCVLCGKTALTIVEDDLRECTPMTAVERAKQLELQMTQQYDVARNRGGPNE